MSDKDTIYRQDAIDALADYIHNMDKVLGTGRLTLYDCKDAATSVFEELPSVQSKQQWIPCSERLPEDDVEVLITDDSGGVQWLGIDSMLSYEDGSGRFWISSQNPTAWMPLPKPWKGEKDG